MSIRSLFEEATQDPVSYEMMAAPVILMKCGHRVDQKIARDIFGELNKQGKMAKSGKCPVCTLPVESYVSDYRIKEISSSFSDSFIQAQVEATEDEALHHLGAQNGNANSIYLLGEFCLQRVPPNLAQALVYLQDAVRKDHVGAKSRLFKLYIDQKLKGNKVDHAVLTACIHSQGGLSAKECIELGKLLEQGYCLEEPLWEMAGHHYELAFYKDANEASSLMLGISSKMKIKSHLWVTLLTHPAKAYPNLTFKELVDLIKISRTLALGDFVTKFISSVVELCGSLPLKMVEVALNFYGEEWAQKYLKSQIVSNDSAVLTRLAEVYLTGEKVLQITQKEAFDLVLRAKLPDNHVKGHYFLGDCYDSEKKYALAIVELKLSVNAGGVEAMLLLGHVYEKMNNYPAALEMFDKAAEAKHPEGLYIRARYKMCGIARDVDIAGAKGDAEESWKALSPRGLVTLVDSLVSNSSFQEVYDLVKDSSVDEAKALLGVCYLKGWGVEKSDEKAKACFNAVKTELSLCLVARAYLEGDLETARSCIERVSINNSDPLVLYLQGKVQEDCNLYESLRQYQKAARLGFWEAKFRIAELFINRQIPVEVNMPLDIFEACFQVLKPNLVQNTLKAIHLCTGVGLEKKDISGGLRILVEAIKAKNVVVIEIIEELFVNSSCDRSERAEAYQVLRNNKTVYLSKRSIDKIADFLQVVNREGHELEEWIVQIKESAPPAFLAKLSQMIEGSELSAFSPTLKFASYKKKYLTPCTIL